MRMKNFSISKIMILQTLKCHFEIEKGISITYNMSDIQSKEKKYVISM